MWPKPEPPAEGQQRDLCRFVKITLGLLIRFIRAIALNGRNRRSDPSMTDKYWGSDCAHLSHERKRLYNRHRARRRRPPQRNRDSEHQVVMGARGRCRSPSPRRTPCVPRRKAQPRSSTRQCANARLTVFEPMGDGGRCRIRRSSVRDLGARQRSIRIDLEGDGDQR